MEGGRLPLWARGPESLEEILGCAVGRREGLLRRGAPGARIEIPLRLGRPRRPMVETADGRAL